LAGGDVGARRFEIRRREPRHESLEQNASGHRERLVRQLRAGLDREQARQRLSGVLKNEAVERRETQQASFEAAGDGARLVDRELLRRCDEMAKVAGRARVEQERPSPARLGQEGLYDVRRARPGVGREEDRPGHDRPELEREGAAGADRAGLGARRKEATERQAKREERPVLVGDVLERESGERDRALGI
jgi:hypothetical protein